MNYKPNFNGALVLEDGRIFPGRSFGAESSAEGEAVFTTAMTGYQEIATDPSFYGQIVCMTWPLIGNYGVCADDEESRQPWIAGMIVREYCDDPSNWRSEGTFAAYLKAHGIPALEQVDTRSLTRYVREKGAMRAIIVSDRSGLTDEGLRESARTAWTPNQSDVLPSVSVPGSRSIDADDHLHLALIDCGVKENILRSFQRRSVRVTVLPYSSSIDDIEHIDADGVVTSPGPGDPANAERGVALVRQILDRGMPYMGICLGHQLLSRAIGAQTRKLKFGHRGGNHPVKDLQTGTVYITAQNHGFEVDPETVPIQDGWIVSHINLNDGSVEGLRHSHRPIMSVQYHPEGSPGPLDSQYLFDQFIDRIQEAKAGNQE